MIILLHDKSKAIQRSCQLYIIMIHIIMIHITNCIGTVYRNIIHITIQLATTLNTFTFIR